MMCLTFLLLKFLKVRKAFFKKFPKNLITSVPLQLQTYCCSHFCKNYQKLIESCRRVELLNFRFFTNHNFHTENIPSR